MSNSRIIEERVYACSVVSALLALGAAPAAADSAELQVPLPQHCSHQSEPWTDYRLQELPTCVGNSICSFLQANDQGVTAVQYCECGGRTGGRACPQRWDQFDGQSITQSQSDQYKVRPILCQCAALLLQYCEAAPEVSQCSGSDQVTRPVSSLCLYCVSRWPTPPGSATAQREK